MVFLFVKLLSGKGFQSLGRINIICGPLLFLYQIMLRRQIQALHSLLIRQVDYQRIPQLFIKILF